MAASARSAWPHSSLPQGHTVLPTAHVRASLPSLLKFCRRRGDSVEWRGQNSLQRIGGMIDDQEKSSARPAIILLIAVFVVAGFSVKYGLQTMTWIEGKLWNSDNPWLATVPQALPQSAAAAPPPMAMIAMSAKPGKPGKSAQPPPPSQLPAYNHGFKAPWPGNPTPKGSLTYTEFHFDSGQVIVFFDPDSQVDTMRTLKTSNPAEYQRFATVFADKPLNTNFEMYQAVYQTTPAQLSPIASPSDAMRMNVLLLWKLSFGLDLPCDGAFYSFDWRNAKGFQFGNPDQKVPVAIRAFYDRDHQFRFIFTSANAAADRITQNDINAVLQSLQTVPFIDR